MTPGEQANAEMAQAFAMVMNGHSYNSLDQTWTVDFLRMLRPDYEPLTRQKVDERIKVIEAGDSSIYVQHLLTYTFSGVKEQVVLAISNLGIVSIAVDGWKDKHCAKCKFMVALTQCLQGLCQPSIIGIHGTCSGWSGFFIQICPGCSKGNRCFIFFKGIGVFMFFFHSMTGDFLNREVRRVVQELHDMGVHTASVIPQIFKLGCVSVPKVKVLWRPIVGPTH